MIGARLILFIVVTIGGFVYICNAIPQIKSEPVDQETTIGESPEELAAAGKKIFQSDRAQCLTCHSLSEDPKARCPNQQGVGERAPQARPGMSAAEYLVESVYNPNAFIVSGYPRNQMQPVHKPPIALSHDEILAVVAFLNTLGGKTDEDFIEQVKKIQDPWRKGLLKPEEGEDKFVPPIYQGDVTRGAEAFEKEGCNKCHRVGEEGSTVCPDLTAIGASQSPEYILESVLAASAVIVKGYKELLVIWKDESRNDLRGVPVKWIPDKEHPRTLRLSVEEQGEQVEYDIDLSQVASVGDTTVAVEIGDEFTVHNGEYVSGDEQTGVLLKVFEEGRWVERQIPPEGIDFAKMPMSPMPADFVEKLTPREIYDLVAYMLAQKGKP